MKIKMTKMAGDIDETRNHRIRGIVPTEDNKYLFVEITEGNRLDRKYYTSLSKREYEEKYPYNEYVYVDACFRVDKPEDHYNNYSSEYREYDRKPFYLLQHSKENIIKLLQSFNKSITDIELTDERYIDKYCEDKGFFRLYDNRLKHSYEPLQIMYDHYEGTNIKFLYTCFSASGEEYKEEMEKRVKIDKAFIKEHGEEKIINLIKNYNERHKDSPYKLEMNDLLHMRNEKTEEDLEKEGF